MAWSISLKPKASWRALVRIQAQHLQDEYDRLRPSDPNDPAFSQIRNDITRARTIADQWGFLRDWWAGESVETAWANLQAAREALVRVQDEAVIRAELPYVRRLLINRPPSDPERVAIERWIVDPQTAIDREMLVQIRREASVATDTDHTAVRRFRNLLVMVTAALSIIMVIFALFDAPDRLIIGIGALSGAVTMIIPLRDAKRLSGPYSLEIMQALLKVPAGAATALLAVILLRGGLASGVLAPATGARAEFYAVIFGISQQAFTRLVDQKANELTGTAGPRVDPAKTNPPSAPPVQATSPIHGTKRP